MKWARMAWFYVNAPFVGPGIAAEILREIDGLERFERLAKKHDTQNVVKMIRLHLIHRIKKILGLY